MLVDRIPNQPWMISRHWGIWAKPRWYQQVTAILNSRSEKGKLFNLGLWNRKTPLPCFQRGRDTLSIQRAECPSPAVNVLAAVETFSKIYFQQLNAMCENWAFHRGDWSTYSRNGDLQAQPELYGSFSQLCLWALMWFSIPCRTPLHLLRNHVSWFWTLCMTGWNMVREPRYALHLFPPRARGKWSNVQTWASFQIFGG